MLRLIVAGVVHDVGVVLADENEPGAAHVGGELVDLVEPPIDRLPANVWVPQVSDDEVVGFALGILVFLQVHAADPEPFRLQALDKVPPDEATRPANQSSFHANPPNRQDKFQPRKD